MSNSRRFLFPTAFVNDDWHSNVLIQCTGGIIDQIQVDYTPTPGESAEQIPGIAIPGIPNVHSHAFQRRLAGLSEYRTGEHDSFWTWRQLMFDMATRWSPEDVYEIARGLYTELAQNGYTWVGEFHYLHNDVDGTPYADVTTMSSAVIRAAEDVGIGICIMPVLYQRSGFVPGDLDPAQKRFALDNETFLRLLEKLHTRHSSSSNVQIGMAIHSLRAVDIDSIKSVTSTVRQQHPKIPIHIHVAEQLKEVDECQSLNNLRPVEYLYKHVDVDEHWCLIHATHMTSSEIATVAESGAIAGLCPTTEANLGDGIFPAEEFLGKGGRFAIGSDSHVSVNPRSELRLLEYAQRLTTNRRAVLGNHSQSVGRTLYPAACAGGAQALGLNAGSLEIGKRADIVVLDKEHDVIQNATGDRILDRYLFCDAGNPVSRVMVNGAWLQPVQKHH